ncbi:hypothetical protein SAMN06265379_101196 [Saccharicrinis carchari]|uniref:Uncharacterized protein n=1 Tax=Saccharicrinis carchari TaxID=1168039 RepID=A0A521AJW1_SACCC|nr:hypothetical protein [Saccharicrinis carchari]SMO35051.1 hypothetical protein SAMN06265379_101196 [Saccharicrinis carchari]
MPNNNAFNSDVLPVAGYGQKQGGEVAVHSHPQKESGIAVYPMRGIPCLGIKKKYYICTGHKNTMKRLLIPKIVFQPGKEKKVHL